MVDADHQVIIATRLDNTAVDVGQLLAMIEHTTTTLVATGGGAMPRTWSADAGYASKANLEQVKTLEDQHRTKFFVSTARMKHSAPIPCSPRGRIPRDATVGERMARRLKTKKGRAVYAQRKAIVEPVFGQIHTRQGKHVLLPGSQNVAWEWELLAGCHNLLKLFALRTRTA